MEIPFLDLEPMHSQIRNEIITEFENVFRSNAFIQGDKLTQFEKEYADFSQTKYAIGVSSGLDALYLSLKALNIGAGDEVIVPANTFIATALAVVHAGAKPVFVEPDIKTYNIDFRKIEETITVHSKAIIPVHLYGQACDMNEIMNVSCKYGLEVIEDNAQAHGATFDGRKTGSFGKLSATSFYPGKNLGALGDGGAVTTDDPIFADKIGKLRNYGSRIKYQHELPGHNMRLDELQAAFLSVKLKRLSAWTNERQRIASWYDKALLGIGDIITPYKNQKASHVYHLYVIRTEYRDALQEYLKKNYINTLIHYPLPIHLQMAFKEFGHKQGDFPLTEKIAKSSLSLPLYPGIEEGKLMLILETIKEFFREAGYA